MNHDPGPSSAARQLPPRPEDGENDAEELGGRTDGDGGNPSDDASSSERKEKRRQGLAKKLEFVSHLQKSLDMTVFVYISTLYYME